VDFLRQFLLDQVFLLLLDFLLKQVVEFFFDALFEFSVQ
jgi:hypothetical protein